MGQLKWDDIKIMGIISESVYLYVCEFKVGYQNFTVSHLDNTAKGLAYSDRNSNVMNPI